MSAHQSPLSARFHSGTHLDQELARRKLVVSRSQAESYIKLGKVKLNGKIVTNTAEIVTTTDLIELTATEQYVSRAALKLDSVAKALRLNFEAKIILDVGSSTGGFTDYALKHGAVKSIAVEVGTNQLHPSLHNNPHIELHEQTDIRNFQTTDTVDIVVADVSFISLREILPHVASLCGPKTQIIAMVKPQFEVNGERTRTGADIKHKGIIKNDRMRRDILKNFEQWASRYFRIVDKADSAVSGSKGNVERFYLLVKLK